MKKFKIILIVLSSIFLVSACSSNSIDTKKTENNTSQYKIEYLKSSMVFDPSNYNLLVGYADNVFVGKVNKVIDIEEKNGINEKQKDGSTLKVSGDPYTNFEVIVLENIKGNLVTDKPIVVQKFGGVLKDNPNKLILQDGDIFLDAGNVYIFVTCSQKNGNMLARGEGSNFLLEKNNNNSRLPSIEPQKDILLKIKNAAKSEEKGEKERAKSKSKDEGF